MSVSSVIYEYDEETDIETKIDIEFEYEVIPGSAGAWEHGVQVDPDYDPEFVVFEVRRCDTNEKIEVDDEDYNRLVEEAIEDRKEAIGDCLYECRYG